MNRDAAATRQRILNEAKAHFARHGFDGATVRKIAASAGVAPNLITRYFGGKAGLFRAATAVDLDVAGVVSGPFSSLGDRIAAKVVERWEAADSEDPLLMMLRSAGTSDVAAAALGDFMLQRAAAPLSDYLPAVTGCTPVEAQAQAAAVGSIIMGAVTTRYVLRTGPLAAASRAAVARWLADQIQRLLDPSGVVSLAAAEGSRADLPPVGG
ncbi:TetR family transcriptional regulator [Acidiferrimicrobium sp. IK]|uniref:TetR/AcrR family transcriptional regulator n=1 Tax=Acidiferrimicrobium sp. IK TaxID=2871700 RepID=UPI0021CB95F2|nr:TetR/AcrR family transcriptional regulator [Acidiferrimicrobium sp. IK]MCU4184103.1 TetR family transcriptional regulator [Acidiferrimicrobium sp. IK]